MSFNNSNNGFNNNFDNNCGNVFLNPNISGQPNANNNKQTQPQPERQNLIFVTFTFKKNKKQIYIDVSRYETFAKAIFILENKYEWLKALPQRNYSINSNNEKPISEKDYHKTLKDLGIDENSDIYIIDGQVQDIKANNINDKMKQPINIDTSDMSNNGSREIAVNFKICQQDYLNDKNVIDIDYFYQANTTVKDVLSFIICDQTKLINDLRKGKFFFASKGKIKQKDENNKTVEIEANIVLISENDLDKNMDMYINNYLKSNPSDDNKNFVIWYVEDNFYDKENSPDRKKQYLKTANGKIDWSRKNKWLLAIGAVVLIFGAIALAIELLVLKAALIIMIIGLCIACIGFFWGDLPCCSKLNFRMDKFDYSSGSQRNMMYNRDAGYPRQLEYDNIQNLYS